MFAASAEVTSCVALSSAALASWAFFSSSFDLASASAAAFCAASLALANSAFAASFSAAALASAAFWASALAASVAAASSLSAAALASVGALTASCFSFSVLAAASLPVCVDATACDVLTILASASSTPFLLSATRACTAASSRSDWATRNWAKIPLQLGDRLLVRRGPGLAVGRVPQFDLVVFAGRSDLFSIGPNRHGRHRRAMFDLANLLVVFQVPLAHRAIGAGRDELPFVGRRNGQGRDRPAVSGDFTGRRDLGAGIGRNRPAANHVVGMTGGRLVRRRPEWPQPESAPEFPAWSPASPRPRATRAASYRRPRPAARRRAKTRSPSPAPCGRPASWDLSSSPGPTT